MSFEWLDEDGGRESAFAGADVLEMGCLDLQRPCTGGWALSHHLYIHLNCHRVLGVWQVLKFCISHSLGKLSADRRVIWGLGSLGSSVLRTEVGDPVLTKAGQNWNPS